MPLYIEIIQKLYKLIYNNFYQCEMQELAQRLLILNVIKISLHATAELDYSLFL